MNLQEIHAHLETNNDDIDELVKTYLDLCELDNAVSALKKKALRHLEDEMLTRGIKRGETDVATFGMTNPKPAVGVDEDAWEEAVDQDLQLNKLAMEYEKARLPFLKDTTPSPRPYVRRKRQ